MSVLSTFDGCPKKQPPQGYFLRLDKIVKKKCPRVYEDFKFGASDVQCWSTSSSIIGSWVQDELIKNETWYLPSKNFHHSSCDVYKFVDWARRRDRCTTYVNQMLFRCADRCHYDVLGTTTSDQHRCTHLTNQIYIIIPFYSPAHYNPQHYPYIFNFPLLLP